MRITEKTPAVEIYQKASHLYQLRLLTILALTFIYVVTCKLGKFDTNFWPLCLVVLIEAFINYPYKRLFRDSRSGYETLVASVVIDFLAEIAVLHLLGNVDIFIYSACFFISIVYCALTLPAKLTLRFATLASSLYAGLIAAGHWGLLPQTVSFGPNLDLAQEIAILLRHIAFFYLVAIFVRMLASTLEKKEERLEAFIWELRETNDRIKCAYHLQTDYFARMSHDIRAPINSVLGFSQLMLESTTEPLTAKQRDFIFRIEQSGKKLRELINQVLEISKSESRKMQLVAQEVDLVKVIHTVLDIFYEEALCKGILMGFTGKIETLKIKADELKLRQVLYNLLSNALKFTQKGFIHISLERESAGIKMMVEDSGIGIAPENHTSIFHPYGQTDHALPQKKEIGLGLVISRQFVEMHGGKIWVESEPDKGSRFIITLPEEPPKQQA